METIQAVKLEIEKSEERLEALLKNKNNLAKKVKELHHLPDETQRLTYKDLFESFENCIKTEMELLTNLKTSNYQNIELWTDD